jgi:hypothetical protein
MPNKERVNICNNDSFTAFETRQLCNKLIQDISHLKRFIFINEKDNIDVTLEILKLEHKKHELENFMFEFKKDYIYTPKGKKEVKSIQDIIYYEGLYGKNIYKKENTK